MAFLYIGTYGSQSSNLALECSVRHDLVVGRYVELNETTESNEVVDAVQENP